MKISIIGYGEMAKAVARGLKKGHVDLEVVGRDEEKLKKFAKEFNCDYTTFDNFDSDYKILFLAIKPYALREVAKNFEKEANIVISILAGTPLKELKKYIKAKYYLRAMPNIAAKYQASMSVVTGDKEIKDIGLKIFGKIGEVVWVDSDDEVDMATAIIGSGPAFLALIAEAISDGGVYIGLKRELSEKLTRGLFRSFASLKEDFATIKNEVMSPKGTTAEGIRSLEEDGVRGELMKGIIKTYEKSKKI
ncbi:MAG: pyrroline-5-carboxylate reductase [Nautiliaceae bacterium]